MKVAIIGHVGHTSSLMDRNQERIEIIQNSLENVKVYPITAPKIIDLYFPPITRAERRKQKRKLK